MDGWVGEVWARERDGWFMKLMKLKKKGAKLRCPVLHRIFFLHIFIKFLLGKCFINGPFVTPQTSLSSNGHERG